MTEADTCRELVTPKLVAAGWGAFASVIGEQHSGPSWGHGFSQFSGSSCS